MRLVLGVDTWGLIGGSERYAGAAAEELAARGHDVTVLCTRRLGPPLADVPVEELDGDGDSPAAAAQVASRAAALRPDAALVLSGWSPAAFDAFLDVAPTVRYVQDHTLFCPGLNKTLADGSACHQPLGAACLEQYLAHRGCQGFPRHPSKAGALAFVGALRKHLRRLDSAGRCQRLLVASEYMRGELVQAGLPTDRIAVVPYFTHAASGRIRAAGLDSATYAFLERTSGPLVLAAARLVLPDKGIDFLITSLGKLRSPFRAVIAGAGGAEVWLAQKTREEGLADRVHFAGWQPSSAMEELYARSAVVAFPSVWDEPFGLVGLEAMAHARPVVAFDVGGVREWLEEGVTGLLVPRRDTDALAAALDSLLDAPSRAAALGRAGQERATRLFSVGRGMERLERELVLAARTGRLSAA